MEKHPFFATSKEGKEMVPILICLLFFSFFVHIYQLQRLINSININTRAFTIICLNEEPHIPHQNLSNFWLHQQQLKGLIIKSQKLIIFLLTGWQPNGTLLSTNSISWIIFERTFYVLKCSSSLPTQIEKTAKATLTRKIYFRPNWVLWCKALAISSTTPMRTPTKSWPWTTKTKGTSISKTRNTDWPLLTTPKVLNWKSQVQTHWSKT